MGQTRLELAGVELAQLRQSTVAIVIWSVLGALLAVTGTLFINAAVVYYFWDSHPYLALFGCAAFYLLCALYAIRKVIHMTREERPLFEATLAELSKDRQAVVESMRAGQSNSGDGANP